MHYVTHYVFSPLGCDPKRPYTSWDPGRWQFCSDSSVVEPHLAESFAYLLYTSICYKGPIRCVSMQKRLRRRVRAHRRDKEAAWQLSIAVPVTLVREVRWGAIARERGWGMCACNSVCVCVDVCRSKGSRWLSIVLQISWQSTSSWPVGDTRGLSGRCELCSRSALLLSKTSKIELLSDSRGVGVAWIVTLCRTWMHNDAVFKRDRFVLSSSHESSWERNLEQHHDGSYRRCWIEFLTVPRWVLCSCWPPLITLCEGHFSHTINYSIDKS